MHMNSYGWVTLIVTVVFVTGFFGGHFGYTVDGVPSIKASEMVEVHRAGEHFWDKDVITYEKQERDWFAETIMFFFDLITFRIDGMPGFASIVFIAIPFLLGWIIYRQVRGQD